jgi:hypothetical protein
MASGVILRALLRIGKHRIGGGDFLEARLGPGFLVAVRVVFQGETAEGVLDRLGIGVPGDAEDRVIVALRVGGYGRIPYEKAIRRWPPTAADFKSKTSATVL